MKKSPSKILFVAVCWSVLLTGSQLTAQTPDTLYHVETTDGNEFIGFLMEQDANIIKIKTERFGVLTILRSDIKNITPVKQEAIKAGKYWFDNPQSTRYFWQPNGYGLKRGEGYYQNVWIFVNQVSVGVTDHLTLGAGILPLFLFGGAPTPIWVTPKISIPLRKDKVNIGVGVLAATVVNGEDWSGDGNLNFGIAYGVTTFGSRDKNISLGIGYGYQGDGWAQTPSFTLSFMLRTGDRGYIVSENYLLNEVALLSLGGRRIVKKVGIDFGLWAPVLDGAIPIVLPWLGISVPFRGKSKLTGR